MRVHQYSAQLHLEFLGAMAEVAKLIPGMRNRLVREWTEDLDDLAMAYIAGGEL